jgi:hypothetical protein
VEDLTIAPNICQAPAEEIFEGKEGGWNTGLAKEPTESWLEGIMSQNCRLEPFRGRPINGS